MTAIAKSTNEYFTYICPPVFQRKRTKECEKDALDMLKAYRDYNKISKEDYHALRREIQKADHDDKISDIMCKLRHKIRW